MAMANSVNQAVESVDNHFFGKATKRNLFFYVGEGVLGCEDSNCTVYGKHHPYSCHTLAVLILN